MPIAAGLLRHRVTLQAQITTTNSYGETAVTWVDIATIWAAIAPLSAREFLASQQIQSEVSARLTIRYRDDVRPSMRFLHRSWYYNIEGILADKDSGLEYLTLTCSMSYNESAIDANAIVTESGDPIVMESGESLIYA